MANEDTIDYEIRIGAAQALQAIENVVKEASSIPEVLAAVETATQELADKFGVTFGTAQKEMVDTIKMGEALRAMIEQNSEAIAKGEITISPYLQMLAGVNSPFGEMGDMAGWKGVADLHKEGAEAAAAQAKSEAEVAAQINAQKLAQDKANAAKEEAINAIQREIAAQDMLENKRIAKQMDADAAAREKAITAIQQEIAAQEALNTKLEVQRQLQAEADKQKAIDQIIVGVNKQNDELLKEELIRKENLKLADEELLAVEREGAAVQEQLSTFGQVSRTAQEAANYLRSFTTTQQGKSILSSFFGNYQEAQNTGQQIDALKKGIIELSTATGTTFPQAAKVFNEQFSQIPGIATQTSQAVRELGDDFKRVPEETDKAVKGIDAVRIALGAIVAMIVFNVIQAFGNLFRKIIEGARQIEISITGIKNAERVLSETGIGITPKYLQDLIDKLQVLNPLLSQAESTDIVSTVAGKLGVALNLSKEQIAQYSQVIAIYAAKNIEFGKTTSETLDEMVNAALSGRVSQGINDMGIKLTDAIVKQRAMKDANIQTAEAWDKLSGSQQAQLKFQAMSNLLMENGQKIAGGIPNILDTMAGSSENLNKEWSNLTVTLGKLFGPAISGFLNFLSARIESLTKQLTAIKGPLIDVGIGFTALFNTLKDFAGLPLPVALMAIFSDPKGTAGKFIENLQKAQKAYQDLAKATDTATDAQKANADAINETDFSGFIQKIEDIKQQTMEGFADLRTNLLNKLSDINLKYDREQVDAETDLQRKLADINQKYEEKVQDTKKKQRQKDINDEAKYQLELWELRMRYLMNLDDALHARDARQILRLQRQYEFDKEDLAKKHALQNNERDQANQAELADAKKQRDREIADAKLAYERKLQDQRIAKQRELADLQTWYMRELQDLMTAQQRKMQQLIKGWIDEQKITQQNAAQVYAILAKYFGPGGMTDQLYAYMASSLVANTANAVNALCQIGGGTIGTHNTTGGVVGSHNTGTTGGGTSTRNRAEGGVIIANQPTSVNFGEAGMEAAMFLPMNRIGKNSGSIDLSGNMGGAGVNGQIVIRMDLSPDLEARVVQNSMNNVANVITKINRSKV